MTVVWLKYNCIAQEINWKGAVLLFIVTGPEEFSPENTQAWERCNSFNFVNGRFPEGRWKESTFNSWALLYEGCFLLTFEYLGVLSLNFLILITKSHNLMLCNCMQTPSTYKKNVLLHKGLSSFMANFYTLHYYSDYAPKWKVLIKKRGLNFHMKKSWCQTRQLKLRLLTHYAVWKSWSVICFTSNLAM